MKRFYDFYLWFVPHNLLRGHVEQGSEQSTLSHLFLFGWVATPMKSKFLSSVQVGLLLFHLERVERIELSSSDWKSEVIPLYDTRSLATPSGKFHH